MVIRHGEYRAEVVRGPRGTHGFVYRVYRGESAKQLAHGEEQDANHAANKAEAVIDQLLRRDAEEDEGQKSRFRNVS